MRKFFHNFPQQNPLHAFLANVPLIRQFGNMLVLSAVYRSQLGYLVDQAKVVSLLERTIDFLHRLKNISETLHTDAKILENVLQVVKNEDGATASSFSST